MGAGIIGADERAAFIRPRRDVASDDNPRRVAAKIFAGVDVDLERTLVRHKRNMLVVATVADRGLQRCLRWAASDPDAIDRHG